MPPPAYPDLFAKHPWYHGPMSRDDATRLLSSVGSFLVRDSSTKVGDMVLTVRENAGIKNYVIEMVSGQFVISGGNTKFNSLAALIEHFHNHRLDDSKLSKAINRPPPSGAPAGPPPPVPGVQRPAEKYVAVVQALYRFAGAEEDELPFEKGETMRILEYTTPEWWMASKSPEVFASMGGKARGMIPSNYVKKLEEIPQPAGKPPAPATLPPATPAPAPAAVSPTPVRVVQVPPMAAPTAAPPPVPVDGANNSLSAKSNPARLSQEPPPSPKTTAASAVATSSEAGRLLSKNEIDKMLDTNFDDILQQLDNI